MPLKAGSKSADPPSAPGDYTGSMAEAIENAFSTVYKALNPGKEAPKADDNTRILYLAIAQGVIQHLKDNAGSFNVSVTNGGDTYKGQVTGIDTI